MSALIYIDNSSSQTGMSIPTPATKFENIILNLNFDFGGKYITNALKVTNAWNSTIKIKCQNGSCSTMIAGFYDFNNRYELIQDPSFIVALPIKSITSSVITGTVNADPISVENCTQIIFTGIFNYNAEIIQGNFVNGIGMWTLDASPSQFPFRVI